jgi:hypothetical protein
LNLHEQTPKVIATVVSLWFSASYQTKSAKADGIIYIACFTGLTVRLNFYHRLTPVATNMLLASQAIEAHTKGY